MFNIFQIGGQVMGQSFIGRHNLLKTFRRDYLENHARSLKSIMGLTRTGKSSLIANVFCNIPDGILYIPTNVSEWRTYIELWQDICYKIVDCQAKCNKNGRKTSLGVRNPMHFRGRSLSLS